MEELKMENIMDFLMGQKLNRFIRLTVFTVMLAGVNLSVEALNLGGMEKTDSTCYFKEEVNEFIGKVNSKYYKINEYFVYVIHVFSDSQECRAYTMGFIFNESDFDRVKPEYQVVTDNNIVIVSFDPDIKERYIPCYDLIEIDSDQTKLIKSKLLKESEGYITGVFLGLGIKDCEGTLDKMFYENSDIIPSEQSIFRSFPIGVEIELIRKGK